jgi:hypothetical protein
MNATRELPHHHTPGIVPRLICLYVFANAALNFPTEDISAAWGLATARRSQKDTRLLLAVIKIADCHKDVIILMARSSVRNFKHSLRRTPSRLFYVWWGNFVCDICAFAVSSAIRNFWPNVRKDLRRENC